LRLRHIGLPWAIVLAVATTVPLSRAVAQERVTIAVAGATAAASAIRLETFIYRPTFPGPFPILVLSHGSSAGNPKASLPARELATYFVKRGFIVIVPMRRGRGQSSGVSREYEERHCDPAAWEPGIDDAIEDVTAAIDYGRTLRDANPKHVTLVGVSRGGFLSVAYAARGPRRATVDGVINFVGAWTAQREDQCPDDFNARSFARFGAQTHVPMLWLYGDQDAFNSSTDIVAYADRFRSTGGDVEFALIHGVPGSGHALSEFPNLWQTHVEAYLDRVEHSRQSRSNVPSNQREKPRTIE
jgi:dienelactone hydrolase